MGKKSSGNVKKLDIVDLLAYVALVLIAFLFIISAILKAINISTSVLSVFATIQNVAIIGALAIGGFSFTRGKGVVIKVLYYIAIITYIVALVLGIVL